MSVERAASGESFLCLCDCIYKEIRYRDAIIPEEQLLWKIGMEAVAVSL